MPSRSSQFNLALLVVLLLSLTAVSVHVATHGSVDQQTCELCSGHGNPSHAIPVTTATPEAPASVVAANPGVFNSLVIPQAFSYQQRAPPPFA